jgi:aryl-alcohol dehydrogenase-like predicted oxidoreductase
MHYRTLGRTGIKVSPFALGAMMFGLPPGNPDHDDSIRIIHKALDAGINFVDTADRYSGGESEEIVGKALKGRRADVVLATKVNGPMGDDPNQRGNSRRWIMAEVESSLRRLQTDLRRAAILTSFSDEARLDAVEQIIPVAEQAGLRMTHLAMAFAIAHPGVTSALIGPRTMEQLDDLLAGIDVTLSEEILDRIDEIVPPGTDVGLPDQSAYLPPALLHPDLRRRPARERAAA